MYSNVIKCKYYSTEGTEDFEFDFREEETIYTLNLAFFHKETANRQ